MNRMLKILGATTCLPAWCNGFMSPLGVLGPFATRNIRGLPHPQAIIIVNKSEVKRKAKAKAQRAARKQQRKD